MLPVRKQEDTAFPKTKLCHNADQPEQFSFHSDEVGLVPSSTPTATLPSGRIHPSWAGWGLWVASHYSLEYVLCIIQNNVVVIFICTERLQIKRKLWIAAY